MKTSERAGMISNSELPKLLERAIKESGLSYAEVASRFGIGTRQLQRLRFGDSGAGTIPEILRMLGWTIEQVVLFEAPES